MNKKLFILILVVLLICCIAFPMETKADIFNVTPSSFSAVMNPGSSREFEFMISGYEGSLNIMSMWIRSGSNRDDKAIAVTPSRVDLRASLVKSVMLRIKCYDNIATAQYNGKIVFVTEKKVSRVVTGKLMIKSLADVGVSPNVEQSQTNGQFQMAIANFKDYAILLLVVFVGVAIFFVVRYRVRRKNKTVLD